MPAIFCAQCPSSTLVQCEKDGVIYCPSCERSCPECHGTRQSILRTLTAQDRADLKSRGILR